MWNRFLSSVNCVYYGLKSSILVKDNDLFLSGIKLYFMIVFTLDVKKTLSNDI